MISNAAILKERIDAKIEADQAIGESDNTPRRYLGASSVGKKCTRTMWYMFRWADHKKHSGRLLRLFNRGHGEEQKLVELLELIGCEVQRFDPDTVATLYFGTDTGDYRTTLPQDEHPHALPFEIDVTDSKLHRALALLQGVKVPKPRQFGFKGVNGHHAGSCDGRARNVPGVEQFGIDPATWVMLEFKTHNTQSFCKMVAEGMYKSKPEHYAQMQQYMAKIGFPLTVYCGVNKNDDDLWYEFVVPNPEYVAELDYKVSQAIYSKTPPTRVSQSPSWFDCKMCDFREVCHYGKPMQKSCRSCVFAAPALNGEWACEKWARVIPAEYEATGCDHWQEIKD